MPQPLPIPPETAPLSSVLLSPDSATFGVARTLLATLGGVVVTLGYMDSGTAQALIGALLTIGAGGWSLWSKYRASRTIAVAATMPAGTPRTLIDRVAAGSSIVPVPPAILLPFALALLLAGHVVACSPKPTTPPLLGVVVVDPQAQARVNGRVNELAQMGCSAIPPEFRTAAGIGLTIIREGLSFDPQLILSLLDSQKDAPSVAWMWNAIHRALTEMDSQTGPLWMQYALRAVPSAVNGCAAGLAV